MKNFKRYTVTTALPYANGPVHIGHLAGVYVPADIYVRYLRLNSKEVIFIGGSDEHGIPITIKARQERKRPQEIVDKYHEMIKKSFREFGISFDIYSRTSNSIHHKTASEFFTTLYNKNSFIESTTSQLYDEKEQLFLADRYITGTCPNCGNEGAYGDQCEKCGTSLSPQELINPKSTLSGEKPVLKETKHWYLPLDKYTNWLNEWIIEGHKNDWKVNVYGQCKSWIDQGLKPRAVTRDLDWGVAVPLEEAKGKVLYVWFDAPIGYISATKELTKDWEKYWKDNETRLIHFIGKDNIVFHCIIFPAMLRAEGSYILPDNVPANEFMNLEGDKISTSRNWAVWLHEYLEEFKDKQDVLRYVLTANAPETKDNDFTWKDFQAKNNNELVAILGNFINRVMVLTWKYFDGKVPELFHPELKERLSETVNVVERISKLIENFHFREAQSELMNLARIGNKFLTEEEPWQKIKNDRERVSSVLHFSLQLIAALSVAMEPFLPFTSSKTRDMLELDPSVLVWENAGNLNLLKAGRLLKQPVLIFEKIDDKVIEFQVKKLHNSKSSNQADAGTTVFKDEISIEDFSKIDLRIAKVTDAVNVPKTEKLMKLTLDLGTETRTVVSGIAHQYKPEEVTGRQVCYLANLKPRKLKGIESSGMILMVQEKDGRLIFLSPEDVAGLGSTIG